MKLQWLQTQVPIQWRSWKGVGWRWPLQTRKPFKPSKRTKPNKAMPKEANLQIPRAAIPWQAPAPVVNTPRGAPKSLQSPLSCFHADHVAARCAEEHSKLSAGLLKLFYLSKNSEIRPHLTDSAAPALLGQMGTTGCFGSQVQLQTNGTLWPLVYTKLRLLSIYLNMHSLNWMKLKKGFSEKLHIHISEFPPFSRLWVTDKQGDPHFEWKKAQSTRYLKALGQIHLFLIYICFTKDKSFTSLY